MRGELAGGQYLWFRHPAFGADFWSQSEFAARLWRAGVDPYENERHLFHYPPIVIRLFLWTQFFSSPTALRIWVVTLAALMIAGAGVAWRARNRLGAGEVPLVFVIGTVLCTFPVIFTLERANFDLITLAALLLALPLLERERPLTDFLAGCLLAVGPWVKIYPGFMGLGLVALRRRWALGGFVVGGLAIGLAAPQETWRSFEVLKLAIGRVRWLAHGAPFPPWSHSLSIAWSTIAESVPSVAVSHVLSAVPGSVAAGLILGGPLTWACVTIYRAPRSTLLAYPLLLWLATLASFVPDIANDYSLAFLPLAAASVLSWRDSRLVWGGVALALFSIQPVAFPVPGLVLLVTKVCGLFAVGASLVARSRELGLAEPAGVSSRR
jgi:hypothetical protein